MEATDRRLYERLSCYMTAQHAEKKGEEVDFFGHVRNISDGGAMLETRHPVEVGVVLNLTFLQDEKLQVWEGKGKVAWARKMEEEDLVVFGLQFMQALEECLC